jgi:hypothetical protein
MERPILAGASATRRMLEGVILGASGLPGDLWSSVRSWKPERNARIKNAGRAAFFDNFALDAAVAILARRRTARRVSHWLASRTRARRMRADAEIMKDVGLQAGAEFTAQQLHPMQPAMQLGVARGFAVVPA